MLRFDLGYRVNSQPVSAAEWQDAMARDVLDKALRRVRATAELLRCDEHLPSAILRCETPPGTDDLNFTYSFCCEAMKAKVERLMV